MLLDEPTALDVTVAAGIVELIKAVRQKFGTSMLYISHDLGRVMEVCDRVYVMYAGQVVESGPTAQVFTPVIPIRAAPPRHTTARCTETDPATRPCVASPSLANGRLDAPLVRGVRRFSPGSVMLSRFPSLT